MNDKLIAKSSRLSASIKLYICATLVFGAFSIPAAQQGVRAAGPTSFERGCTEMQKKRFREAISCFTEGINVNEKDANAYFRRGQCFLCLKEIDHALSDFDRAIAVTEGNDQYFLWRGTAYGQLGQDDAAIEDFLRAFRLNPELVVNYNKQMADPASGAPYSPVAPELQNQNTVVVGNGANATKDFTEAVKRASQHLTGRFRAGAVFSGINTLNQDTGEKKVAYPIARAVNQPKFKGKEYWVLKNLKHDFDIQQRAFDALPENVDALFNRALDFQGLGDPDHASMDFTRCTELKPKEPIYWLARAYFFHTIGSDEQTKQNIIKAQELDLTLPVKIDFDPEDLAGSATK